MERHWEEVSGNEADVRQVRSTGTLEGNRTGEQEAERDNEAPEDLTKLNLTFISKLWLNCFIKHLLNKDSNNTRQVNSCDVCILFS